MPESIVQKKPRPRDKVWIELSGGRFFTIPEAQASAFAVGDSVSDEDVERLAQIDQYFRGKDKALRMLALRARSRREIVDALRTLSIDESVAQGIVGELEELGLVDDARFASDYIRVKVETKRLGPHRLRYELGKLGVPRGLVDEALTAALDRDSQKAMAWEIIDRRLGTRRADEKAGRRMAGLLRRKGYDYEVVNQVLYELLQRDRSQGPGDDY